MAVFERVNGYLTNYTTGTLRGTADLKAFVLTLDSGSGAIDLQGEDGDAASEADQIVEQVIKELNPLMYHVPSASAGKIHVIMHGHANDAASVKARIVGIKGSTSSVTVHANSTVVLGTSITVA